MDFNLYLNKFQTACNEMDKKPFAKASIELHTGIVLNSVVLKAYKSSWAGDPHTPVTSVSRIFFSIWISEASIKENKLLYNIHALKLRQFTGYKITSRDFAEKFRKQFMPHKNDWPNISLQYGPLTLMEGWTDLNVENIKHDINSLLHNFLKVYTIIDTLLLSYKI